MRTIKLMPDYQSFPLWEAEPERFGNIDPNDLPLSDGLRHALMDWAGVFDATLNISDPAASGFPSIEDEARFSQTGRELGERLRRELGDGYIVVLDI